MKHKVAIVGFGTVAKGFISILCERKSYLKNNMDIDLEVVGISDSFKESIYNENGLKIETILDRCCASDDLDQYPNEKGLVRGKDSFELIRESDAHTIIETTPTDIKTGEPAIAHTKAAFGNNQNVVTSNKGPAALAYDDLIKLATQNDLYWGIEGTVMSGTPVLNLSQTGLYGNKITDIKAILNGTSNYILGRMELGLSFYEALEEAKKYGYAEADPANDIEGYDVLYKTLILSNVCFGKSLSIDDVEACGISKISAADINAAKSNGYRWKLLARLYDDGYDVKGSVSLEEVSLADPLAGISDATNAITFNCDLLGPVTVTGPGAGERETGFALLNDCISIGKRCY